MPYKVETLCFTCCLQCSKTVVLTAVLQPRTQLHHIHVSFSDIQHPQQPQPYCKWRPVCYTSNPVTSRCQWHSYHETTWQIKCDSPRTRNRTLCPTWMDQPGSIPEGLQETKGASISAASTLARIRNRYSEAELWTSVLGRPPCGLWRGSAVAQMLVSRVWIPLRAWIFVCFVYCVLCR